MKRLTAIVLAMIMVLSLAVVTAGAEGLTYAPGTVLRMATGYNSAKTGITVESETAGEGVTLADGVTYNTGTKTEYTVTATVSVNAADMGKLDVSFGPAKEVDFVNTYKAQGISQPITGTKALRGRIVTAKEFEFMIKAEDGTELGKVTNDDHGVITYPDRKSVV